MNVRRSVPTLVLSLLGVALVAPVGAAPAAAAAAPGDEVIGYVEVEDGVIAGNPGLNSGDHGNFSGSGSYTFRETGMSSTMSVTAPVAGTYPVHVRYAAGPLSPAENVTRSMGLLTNDGARQQMQLPLTGDWETWRFVTYDVTLNAGANTIGIACDRSIDFCRLNFDAIQVGGPAPDPCVATETRPGWTALYDGTFASFDGWRKAGGGGFGRQTDCSIRSFRGSGTTWFTTQQAAPYTLELDWKRNDTNDDSSVYVGSSSRAGTPSDGFAVRIGEGTGAIQPLGGALRPADAAAVASALLPVGQPNTFRIKLSDRRLEVRLNGTLVNSLDDPTGFAPTGFVGLENRSFLDSVDFSRIQLLDDIELGRVTAPLRRARVAGGAVNPGGESVLGNLVAETQRSATDAEVALVDPRALAADLTGTAGGYPATVTLRQARAVLPSPDTLVTMRLTGAQLATALEQQWSASRPLLRLGTSTGLAYTYDPTATAGSRVTRITLDGQPVGATTSYTVAMASSLASSPDVPVLAAGTARQDTGIVGAEALTARLEAAAPVAPDLTQHAVGVAFPGGAPASYAAGDPLALDLSSLAFPGEPGLADDAVRVTLGGASLGSFPVDAATGAAATDESGTAAVRTTIPAGIPTGRSTLLIRGEETGTSMSLPITVVAPEAPVRAESATTLSLARPSVSVKRGTVRVTAEVDTADPADATPEGRVVFVVGTERIATVDLADGRASTTVGPFAGVGRRIVQARYLGSETMRASTSDVTHVVVTKATSTARATIRPRPVVARSTRARMAIVVRAPGYTPTGSVRVRVRGASYDARLRGGEATVRLPRFARAGTVTARVVYLGDSRTEADRTTRQIVVVRPRR